MMICNDYAAKAVRDRKNPKVWMLQGAAAYAQHGGQFASQSIYLNYMHKMT